MKIGSSAQKTCGYVSPFDGYQCDEPVWAHSDDGTCLGHSSNFGKPKKEFLHLIISRLKSENFNFDGFVFPSRLVIKNMKLTGVISFIGSTLQKGLLFENCKIIADQIRFDQCWFEDGDLTFNKCILKANKISFADSALTGNSLEFRACKFISPLLEFDRAQWRASKHIAFICCDFHSPHIQFKKVRLKAPVISFFGSSFRCKTLDFDRAEFYSKRLTMKKSKLLSGESRFSHSKLDCNHLDFTHSIWLDKGLTFSKADWQGRTIDFSRAKAAGRGITFSRSRLIGKSVLFNHINIEDQGFECQDTKIELTDTLDFSSAKVSGSFRINRCKLSAQTIKLNDVKSKGKEFSVQQNTINSPHFSVAGSLVDASRISFTRSTINSQLIDFKNSQFKGLQLSFQSLQANADQIQFDYSLFDSRRTAFNKTQFNARSLTFKRTNFGSGTVTFWKTAFNANVDFSDSRDRGAAIHFNADMASVRFSGNELDRCYFHESTWPEQGWMRRKSTADEKQLILRDDYESLQELYKWIAERYSHAGQNSKRNDFLYSSKEIERWDYINKRFVPSIIRMEILRWTTGYGLGLARVGVIRGAVMGAATILPVFIKMR